MKTFISGMIASIMAMGILFSIGDFTHHIGHSVRWMVILGELCCFVALILASGGANRRGGGFIDSKEKKTFSNYPPFSF